MEELVNKLKEQARAASPAGGSAIFGSVGSLSAGLRIGGQRLKVGLWPVTSMAEAEAALGLGALLAALLEQWPSVRVYRLMAKLEGAPQDYTWAVERSQFGVDDWELEGLDENVAIWGRLDQSDDEWKLALEVENDLAQAGEDTRTFTVSAAGLGGLVAALPQVAAEIAEYLEAGDTLPYLPAYSADDALDHTAAKDALEALCQWELYLFLMLWGKPWPDDQIVAQYQRLLNAGEALDSEAGAWIVTTAASRAMLPIYAPSGEPLISRVVDMVERFEDYDFPAVFLARALHRLDYRHEAYNLLEGLVEAAPEGEMGWLMLAEVYAGASELAAAVDAYQRAIEAGVESVEVYLRYADLLLLLDSHNVVYGVGARQHSVAGRDFVEGFVLIDPEETESEWLRWEAVEAYYAALEIEPEQPDTHFQLAMQLSDLGDESLWEEFAELVAADENGERTRAVVDGLYGMEDISPAISVLRDASARQPERADLKLSLAAVYLMDDQTDAARRELLSAGALSDALAVKADIDRLMLSVDDPDFEARFGEISDVINAGNAVSASDVEFLEDALERAPNFAAAYTVLAGAYLAWQETDDALEVLLDGQRRFPDYADILVMLGRTLWNAGEKTLAFDYLNKGLAKNPNHVPLLAQTGRFLFDSGQDEGARLLLMRAEALDPRHPLLTETRAHIARTVSSE